MISATFRIEYTPNQQFVSSRVRNIILCYTDFENDMFVKTLRFLCLHSTPLNQVGEVMDIQPYFQPFLLIAILLLHVCLGSH